MKKLMQHIKSNYSKEQYKKFINLIDNIDVLKELSNNEKAFNYSLIKGVANAKILCQVKIDFDTILASLCLDIIRNNLVQINDLGLDKSVEKLIVPILKIEDTIYKEGSADLENLRGMFVAMSKDIRVLIVKLADILESARNCHSLSREQADYLHKQIKEIYAPLAARLGLSFIKSELEDENFRYLKPEEYEELSNEVLSHEQERKVEIKKSIDKIKKLLKELNIHGEVSGRVKHISSIYKKLEEKAETLKDIYDLSAVRVIVKEINECYAVLGGVHTIYTPIENRFKDYIAKPKANGYQSLHTTVKLDTGEPLEVQIRTQEMHDHAEYGIAAHWMYKEHKSKGNSLDKKLTWIRQIIENQESLSAAEIIEDLKSDVYAGEIFVQTPKGNIIELPVGATPVDFAYNIHSAVGNKCVGAKVNGKMVPLNTQLNNGETVEIITASSSKGPSLDWLKFVKSASSRNKINAFFKKERKEENIKKGKSILEQAAKARSVQLHKLLDERWLKNFYERYSLSNLEDMYSSVGHGALTGAQVITKLKRLHDEFVTPQKKAVIIKTHKHSEKNNQPKGDAIIVKGLNNILTRFAKCCTPVPGDDIKAFISRGKGATIHRASCSTLEHVENERLLEAEWGNAENNSYIAELNIICNNSSSSLAAITNKISDLKINIVSIAANQISNERALINLIVSITKKDQLATLMKKLNSIRTVEEVYRGSGN